MISPIKYLAVNWVDGMKLASSHFVAADLHHTDQVRDAISLSVRPYTYGLLPPFAGETTSLDLQVIERSTGLVELVLNHCNAILLNGDRVDFFAERQADTVLRLNFHVNEMTGEYLVLLSCNTFDRIPTGIPDAEEEPLRLPSLRKSYRLIVVPVAELETYNSMGNCLPLSKLQVVDGVLTTQGDFIPPCACINGHPALIEYRVLVEKQLNQLELASFKIIRKTQTDDLSEIGKNMRFIAETLLNYISSAFFTLRNQIQWEPPIDLIGYISTLAHRFYTALKLIPTKERETLLRYFYEWQHTSPGDFDRFLAEVIEIRYLHEDCLPNFQQISAFLQTIVTLWDKLATLEFLGQHRENIVVAEQRSATTPPNKTTWSLLD